MQCVIGTRNCETTCGLVLPGLHITCYMENRPGEVPYIRAVPTVTHFGKGIHITGLIGTGQCVALH